jgi:hypothetical protein
MRYRYHDRDRDNQLSPGMSKSDRLPPGLEKQLRVRRTLPPRLRKRLMRCPEEIEHRLPPPPPDCAHVVIGRHVALVNRNTYMVLDIFHFEQLETTSRVRRHLRCGAAEPLFPSSLQNQ